MSLRFGILGLLAEQSLHGYEVKNRFESLLGGTWEVNIGQIYSTLQRLERDGLVEPADDRGNRGKLPYHLTATGRRTLDDWLRQPEDEPQQLREGISVKLLLASRLANGNLDRLLVDQRRVYLQRLKDLAGLEREAREQRRDDLVLLVKGAVLHTEADLKWTDVWSEEVRRRSKRGGGS